MQGVERESSNETRAIAEGDESRIVARRTPPSAKSGAASFGQQSTVASASRVSRLTGPGWKRQFVVEDGRSVLARWQFTGMGKVWRAHHTALKRDDAVKVLPDAFVSDPERLARFRREAQVLASLNHPNIAHVYGLEYVDGVQALVMELVEGPTLVDRIAQEPVPTDEALPIAKQIAEAL